MNHTADDILKMVELSRERIARENLVIANSPENPFFSSDPREVYKDEKIEREKDISRDIREENQTFASHPFGELLPLPQPQVVLGNESGPRELTTRGYTGISAQHAKTKTGVKVSITVQSEAKAQIGEVWELTAELKRHDRLRELKAYADDSYEFAQMYSETIRSLKELTPDQGRNICMGRVHDRGARAAWYADILVVGTLNDAGHLIKVLINLEGDEYEIDMDVELSPRQQELYHTGGLHGNLRRAKSAPRLATAKTRPFNP
jgi:hypothetical protein